MNSNEILKARIQQARKELQWLEEEYRRLNAGEDPFGDPGSLSEAEQEAITRRKADQKKREAFRKLASPEAMNEILEKMDA